MNTRCNEVLWRLSLAGVCAAGLVSCGGSETQSENTTENQTLEAVPGHELALIEFIGFMREGDVESAALLVDPASPGYPEFEQALSLFAQLGGVRDESFGVLATDYVRTQFSVVYIGAGYKLISEPDGDADTVEYLLEFDPPDEVFIPGETGQVRLLTGEPSFAEMIIPIHRVDGEWFLYPGTGSNGLLRPIPLDTDSAQRVPAGTTGQDDIR